MEDAYENRRIFDSLISIRYDNISIEQIKKIIVVILRTQGFRYNLSSNNVTLEWHLLQLFKYTDSNVYEKVAARRKVDSVAIIIIHLYT